MINEMTPLSMVEAIDLIESVDESGEKKETSAFLKKFTKLKPAEAKKIREELEDSGIIKIKGEHVAKIIDLLPETSVEVNKIFINESLNEDETNKILEIVKRNI